MRIVVLNKHDLQVGTFASKDDARPILRQVLVRKVDNKIQLIATDSYVLIRHSVVPQEAQKFEPFLVPAIVLERAAKLLNTRKNHDLGMKVELHTNFLEIPEIGVKISCNSLDANYPDIDKLIDGINHDHDPKKSVTLNPEYTAKAASFLKSSNAYYGKMDVKLNAPLAPAEFYTENTYILVMPLKS